MSNEYDCECNELETHCEPTHAHPEPQNDEACEGSFKIECHCHKLKTRTFVINVAPQQEAALRTYLQNTFNAWQNAGYLIMAHSIIDTGAGWTLIFTVGFYV